MVSVITKDILLINLHVVMATIIPLMISAMMIVTATVTMILRIIKL